MSRFQAHLMLILTAMIWGSTFIVQKTAFSGDESATATQIGPIFFTGLRFLLGAVVVLPLALRESRRANAPMEKNTKLMFFLTAVVLFAATITQQIGIIGTSVTNAGFLTAFYVPMVPILALVLFRTWPRIIVWPAAMGCVMGAYFLNGGNLTEFSEGDLWVLLSSIFWSLHITLVGIYVLRSARPFALALMQCLVGGVVGVVVAFGAETISISAIEGAWFEIVYAGVFSVGIAYTMQVVAQGHTHPATAAIIMSSEMLFAALFAAIFLGERIGTIGLIGCGLIFISALAVEIAPYVNLRNRSAKEIT